MRLAVKAAVLIVMLIALAVPAQAADMAAKLNAVLLNGLNENNWQIKAEALAQWISEGRKDFLVIDVRPNPAEHQAGRIPGSIYISYNKILMPENLAKLPKDKKVILVCVTGQTQNLPIVALRALGYDARTLSFGHASWIKGYWGGNVMKGAIAGAEASNYPVVR